MGWPVREITFEGYGDWTVEARDLSVAETLVLESAMKTKDFSAIVKGLVPAIQSWTILDSNGQVIPVTEEGCRQIPMKVMGQLLVAILKGLNEQALPKATNSSAS